MERWELFVFGALFFFALAFILAGVMPHVALSKVNKEYQTIEMLAAEGPSESFIELQRYFPEQFEKVFGISNETYDAMAAWALKGDAPDQRSVDKAVLARYQAAYGDALRFGRDTYIAEACWHCHSQYIRPVANESKRWGPVSMPQEYNNALQMPPLWGTRRTGPDLTRQNRDGDPIHSNGWHIAHLFHPPSTTPGSVMPRYPWFFEQSLVKDEDGSESWEYDMKKPGRRALSVVTYLQWLGTTRNQVPADVSASGAPNPLEDPPGGS